MLDYMPSLLLGNYYPLGQVGLDYAPLEHAPRLYPWVVRKSGMTKILSIY